MILVQQPKTLLLACAAASCAGLFLARSVQRPVFDPSADKDAICSAERPYAAEELPGQPNHRFSVTVPAENPLPGQSDAPIVDVVKDDIIEVEVHAPRPGAIAMHGILDPHRVRVGGTVSVKLRARYTGRFPLHFHGDDGSHFEVAVFEVGRGSPR